MKLNNTNKLRTALFILSVFLIVISCSSVPKKPAVVLTERTLANNQFDLANRMTNQGNYIDALFILDDARRIAVITDDPPLLIKTGILYGSIFFKLGLHDDAFEYWEAAIQEADSADQKDLAAFARIHTAQGRLVLLLDSGEKTGVAEIRDQVSVLVSSIKNDNQARAAGYVVLGLAEKELELYSDAEKTLRRAVDIHEKGRYLEETAYDWYVIASVFSVAQRYNEALAALRTAIDFDRRAENGFGLASSWQAMGEVYRKMNRAADSAMAYRRAASIYYALGLDELAEKAEAGTR